MEDTTSVPHDDEAASVSSFDPIGGATGKRNDMDRAERHADPAWWAFMLAAGIEVARRKPRFNTDDMERIRQHRQGPRTHENRALGPLMRELQKQGVCEPTEDWVESSQRGNHRRPMRVWHSLIYIGPVRIPRPRPRRIIDPRQLDMWVAVDMPAE
jgi:hypothetical protein